MFHLHAILVHTSHVNPMSLSMKSKKRKKNDNEHLKKHLLDCAGIG